LYSGLKLFMNKNDHITLDVPMQRMERHTWVTMPLPGYKSLLRFVGWGVGRVAFSSWLFSLSLIRNVAKAVIWVTNNLEQGTKKILKIYDALPMMGTPLQSLTVDTESKPILSTITDTLDITTAIQGKHVLIIGSTGTGKSTIAQWLATQSASQVKVYDSDAAPTEWQGLEVVGRGGDFTAIETSMTNDLKELQNRIEKRSIEGDKALSGMDSCIIAEEFPILKDECAIAPEWLGKIARRGRKPKMFIIALSQSDTVAALGIEGDGAIRSNFRYIRLGNFAVTHAKKLKNEALIQWLQAGKYRCLVDDDPCQIPDLNSYKLFTSQLPNSPVNTQSVTPEIVKEQELQPNENDSHTVSQELKNALFGLKQAGWSDSKLITEVLGMGGRKYSDGKYILQKIGILKQ
jgi:energy-coupling factor transporter ATP-binding protein EcfA2